MLLRHRAFYIVSAVQYMQQLYQVACCHNLHAVPQAWYYLVVASSTDFLAKDPACIAIH